MEKSTDKNNTKYVYQKEHNTARAAVIGAMVFGLVIILTTVLGVNSARQCTNEAVNKVRGFYMQEMAKKCEDIVFDEIKKKYGYVKNALSIISPKDLESKKALRSCIRKIKRSYGLNVFAFVDESGVVNSGHSTCSGLTRYPFLKNKIIEPTFSVVNVYGANKQMILTVPTQGLVFEGKKIECCFVQIDLDDVLRSMISTSEDMKTFSNMYHKNGDSLTNISFGPLDPNVNLLAALAEHKITSDKTIEDIKSDFETGKSGYLNIVSDDGNGYMYYMPIRNADWILVNLVYDKVIGNQIGTITNKLLRISNIQIGITVLALFAVFVTLLILITKNSELAINKEKSISEEQLYIIQALSQDYKNIFKINTETRMLSVLKLTGAAITGFDEHTEAVPYSDFVSQYIKDRVYSTDANFIAEELNFDNVIRHLQNSDEYVSSFRVIENGEIHYYQFTYIILENNALILGFKNIDGIIHAEEEHKKLLKLSETDRMTGLLNRGSGEQKISEAFQSGKGGLFILLDIDKFKFFNDNFGHEVGDKVIINVADCLKNAFREQDIVFRLGGDEFSAFAPDIDTVEDANKVLLRFKDSLTKISIPELKDVPITASIGASVIPPNDNADFSEKYKLVDSGVYESKKISGTAITFKW